MLESVISRSARNRGIFIALVALLIAVWFLKMAFRLAGAALQIVVVVIVVLAVLGYVTSRKRG